MELLNGNNNVEFCFQVDIEKEKQYLVDFDIDDTIIEIDKLIKNLSIKMIEELDLQCPMYTSLSIYFFGNLKKLSFIIFEASDDLKSVIYREDIS